MSISSLSAIASSYAAPLLQRIQQAATTPPSPQPNSSTAPTFANILSSIGSTGHPLSFLSSPASSPPTGDVSQPSSSFLSEFNSLLASM
jgi:hypothetical protein